MALKSSIFSLALGTLLLGSSALAQEAQRVAPGAAEPQLQAQGFRGGHGPGHGGPSHHGPRPSRPSGQEGRYELQTVQVWSQGRYEQVWVPEQCHSRPRRGVKHCEGGYYQQQWVPGRYETVEKWVWVPARYHRYGRS
ncbi:hypothetical protein [Stigmatella erecta]|uniref:YXWGXW repeat-containing protein n=1 Tax=Stigmatella erecta TaxID=83460 RepID=A0A1I0LD51_9BACT|nr:hypothetical protein [Stigmatella erecta]SEU37537.1 hypothetical protein SAMN05443639_12442 [Stigmatella erecta]